MLCNRLRSNALSFIAISLHACILMVEVLRGDGGGGGPNLSPHAVQHIHALAPGTPPSRKKTQKQKEHGEHIILKR